MRSLNPYCYGIPSQSTDVLPERFVNGVLILIVMEYLLRGLVKSSKQPFLKVLILIVMEYLLRGSTRSKKKRKLSSLNPYCYGIPSQRLTQRTVIRLQSFKS